MTVEYRQTWRQVVPLGLLTGVLVMLFYRSTSGIPIAVGGAIGGVMGMRQGRVLLSPESVTVSRFGRRTIPWTEVDEVRRVHPLGGNGVQLVVDGRRVALAAPVHTPFLSPDPEFEEKAATIERYWRGARSRGGTG